MITEDWMNLPEVEETPQERRINDKIDKWHLHYKGDMPLHEYLGWTWDEYVVWVTTRSNPHGDNA